MYLRAFTTNGGTRFAIFGKSPASKPNFIVVPSSADVIRQAVAGKERDEAVVRVPGDLIRRFKGDLRNAGTLFRDDSGRVAGFHSLRKCCSTLLTMEGVHPRVAQGLDVILNRLSTPGRFELRR